MSNQEKCEGSVPNLLRRLSISPLMMTLVYLGFGALWLIVTDILVDRLILDIESLLIAQLTKGFIYILTTSLFIYWLARKGKSAVEATILRRELVVTERTLHAVLDSIGAAVVIVDPSSRTILDCNQAAGRIFGYRQKSEMVGQPTAILHVDQEQFEEFGRLSEAELERSGIFRTEFRMRRRDGTIFATDNTVTPVHEDLGWRAGVVSVVQDISDRKEVENRIKDSLEEKQVMLKEIHHRVKNNLSVVTSLLHLQTRIIETPQQAITALHNSYSRILAMSLVHEELYRSGSFLQVDMCAYIQRILPHFEEMVPNGQRITIDSDCTKLSLDVNHAIPCALILNELVANAVMHAFPGDREGAINISFDVIDPGRGRMKVEDDGIGITSDVLVLNRAEGDKSTSLGYTVITALIDQLYGEISLDAAEGEGSRLTVTFPL